MLRIASKLGARKKWEQILTFKSPYGRETKYFMLIAVYYKYVYLRMLLEYDLCESEVQMGINGFRYFDLKFAKFMPQRPF